ncbi:type I secretion membrane fusion protein, HlyD family [Gulbenkiania indica]|uniref:Membrane fusion protein (MFP) family protein n=1 Tax=Gulbenkiania indica TaxID=375574 RepID=A0A0K6GXS7_9NEIS|nr:HlyD family type I secretion periplasmic adaptor subunit [Gulbenkiania indica]CUA83308.1 type I secretion membrane fusion protein, HlyD family [Gulbenkiania indica]
MNWLNFKKKAHQAETIEGQAQRTDALPQAPVDTDDKSISRWGMRVLLVGFGGFVLWAALAPLDEGVTANGTVIVASNRQTVQHLTGGIVDSILVEEGQPVKKGQPLVRLNDTQARAQLGMTLTQYISAKAVEDRLISERDNRPAVTFSPDLEKLAEDPRVREAKALQTQLFNTRRAALQSELGILRENLQGLSAQLSGYQALRESRQAQSRWITEELKGVRDLAQEGYVPKNRLYQLERSAAEANGALADTIANIGRTQNGISEVKMRLVARQQEYQKEVESQLTDIQKEATALADKLNALRYETSNTVIRAPMDGYVVGLKVHTVGGVVQGGQPLMDVVPHNEPLIIEAMVDPSMSAKVKPGMPVDITFPALNQHTTPVIPGEVQTFSADRLVDQKTGAPYFLAQVKVTSEGMKLIGKQQIRPGMPAAVVMKAGERTFLEYLLKPLKDRMALSFKEE